MKIASTLAAATAFALAGTTASAAELRLFYPGALHSALHDLEPGFERAAGHKIAGEDGPAGAVAARVEKGETADVVIATTGQIDALAKSGRVVAGSSVVIAKVGMGVATRAGAARPDVSTLEALERALLAAKSIGFPDPAGGSSSGIYAAKLIAGMASAATLQAKVRVFPTGAPLFAAVAKGEVDLCLGQLTELIAAPGLGIAGRLPQPIQNYTEFSGAVVTSARQPEAAKALLAYLTAPAALSTMQVKGFEAGH
jgi:molybdate transport system substrate-binding protein